MPNPNNTFADATEILTVSAGTVLNKGTLDAASATEKVDYYKFTTASTSNVNISLTDLTGNAQVRLGKLNAAGTTLIDELPASTNSGKLSESLLKTGIAAGTYYIEVTLSGSAPTADYTLSTFASADTSYSSLLWRNETLNVASTWQLQGKSFGYAKNIPDDIEPISRPPNYYIAGIGDFNADGADDIIWRDRNNGGVETWMMDGKTLLRKADGSYDKDIAVGSIPGNWILAGVADMDGDRKSDMLWLNREDGNIYVWRMDGTKITSVKQIEGGVPGDWEVQDLADTNKDGKADILWRQTSTGTVGIWALDAGTASGLAAVPVTKGVVNDIDLNYKIVAFKDVTGDGRADITWRNDRTGQIAFWEIDGVDFAKTASGALTNSTFVLDTPVPTSYFIASVADFDGDGRGDLLWRNNQNGEVAIWRTDLASPNRFKPKVAFARIDETTGAEVPLTPGGEYTIEAVRDFNGDGKADIFWRNISAAATGVWTIKSFAANNDRILLDLPQSGFISVGANLTYDLKGVLNTKFTRQPQTLTTGDIKTAFNLGIADGTGNYIENVSGTSKDLYKFKLERTSAVTLALLNPSNLSQPQGGVTRVLRREGPNGILEDVTFTDGQRLLAGVYQLEVGSAGGTAVVPYNLRVTGIPIAVDLVGKVFTPPATVNLDTALPTPTAKKAQISVNYTIENKEPSDSGPVKVKFYLSRNETIDPTDDKLLQVVSGATLVDQAVVTNVPGSNTAGVAGTVTLELPEDIDLFWTGDRDYYIGMVIDPATPGIVAGQPDLRTGEIEEVGERDASNQPTNTISNNYNQAIGKDKAIIAVSQTKTPNLKVLAFNTSATTLTRGSDGIGFTYQVANLGKRSTEGLVPVVQLGLYISDRDDLTESNLTTVGAERLSLLTINSGNPIGGEQQTAVLNGTFSLSGVNSTFWKDNVTQYYLYAFVDPRTVLDESVESDNVFKLVSPLTVNP
jgi:FG-GAP-like repeat/Bacterial pre-peptidase C-terminal domain